MIQRWKRSLGSQSRAKIDRAQWPKRQHPKLSRAVLYLMASTLALYVKARLWNVSAQTITLYYSIQGPRTKTRDWKCTNTRADGPEHAPSQSIKKEAEDAVFTISIENLSHRCGFSFSSAQWTVTAASPWMTKGSNDRPQRRLELDCWLFCMSSECGVSVSLCQMSYVVCNLSAHARPGGHTHVFEYTEPSLMGIAVKAFVFETRWGLLAQSIDEGIGYFGHFAGRCQKANPLSSQKRAAASKMHEVAKPKQQQAHV